MILRRLRLHPFGAFADRSVSFRPGLNVVLGPNEAGKSTLFGALGRVLLVRPDQRATEKYRDRLRRILPARGADTARVELAFESAGGAWVLRRSWGAAARSELAEAGGTLLADEQAVAERIAALLPARPPTVLAVMMAAQSSLAGTIESLAGESEPLEDLGTALRRVGRDLGGVSVDRLRRRLDEELKRHFSRWEPLRGAPESPRRFSRDVGLVLAAWYALEDARAALERARAFERQLDELNATIASAAERHGERERFLAEHGDAARDAQQRRALEAEQREAHAARARLSADYDAWPVLQAEAAEREIGLAAAEQKLAAVAAELGEAEEEQRSRALRDRVTRMEAVREALAAAEAGLEGPAVAVRLEARRRATLSVSQDGGVPQTVALEAGEAREVGPAAHVRIEHAEVVISASASGDARDRGSAASEARDRLADQLAAVLAGETIEGLRARSAALGPERQTRPVAAVASERGRAETAVEQARRDLEAVRRRIAELERTHGSREALFDRLSRETERERSRGERLAACAPLPPGFADAEAFLRHYEQVRREETAARDALSALRQRRAALEGGAPEASSEELEPVVAEASSRFELANARGMALLRIRQTVSRLLDTEEAGIWAGLHEDVARRFTAMTLGRWQGLQMAGGLPKAARPGDGPSLPPELLSTGARDLLGLAVRLAMAALLVPEGDGFLVMDDPLVDLDPDRRQAAAEALREFAAKRQLVVFTCHPAHAELLGGELVRL